MSLFYYNNLQHIRPDKGGRRIMDVKNKAKIGRSLADRSPEEHAAISRKGQAAQAKNKRARKTAKEVLLDLLATDSTDKDIAAITLGKGLAGDELTTLLYNMTKKASKSANMAELVFKLTGDLEQAPQQNITIVNQLSDEQLQQQINQLRGNDGMIDVTPEPPKLE
jgi:hypothetical protein